INNNLKTHLKLWSYPHCHPAFVFVCLGGSPNRMKAFALFMHKELGLEEGGEDIKDICAGTDRCGMYKLGSYSPSQQGVGSPCVPMMMLHELITLLHRARCCDATVIPIATWRRIGEMVILDDLSPLVLNLNKDLAEKLFSCSKEIPNFPNPYWDIKSLNVLHSLSGQGQLDGALCSFSKGKKLDYLKRAHKAGLRDIEMESTVFAAMCGLCGLKAAVVWVTLLDRLDCAQISLPHDVLLQSRPWLQFLFCNFIKQRLGLHDQMS
uniref:Uridine phosphorylase 2 n=1 Tax=Prolemur simus TaxID=1328070 RepID=A0A8C8ZJX4_PROSS